MGEIKSSNVQMSNGQIFSGEKISELTEFIINKFADEKLSHDEGLQVVQRVEEVLGEYSVINKVP